MKKKLLRFLSAVGAALFAFSSVAGPIKAFAFGDYQKIKNSNMAEYHGSYDAATYPYEHIEASFTGDNITVDGVLEDSYYAAPVSRIDNSKVKGGYGLDREATYGELRTLWDGPVLYLGISVYDDCVLTSTETTKGALSSNPACAGTSVTTYPYASWGGFWATWAVTETKETCDSIALAVDLFNDRTDYEIDTAGIVVIDALGQLYYYSSSNIPSLGSALGDPGHPEYMNIIKGYAAAPMYDETGKQIGYTVEVALHIEELEMKNGTEIGVDIKINDVNDIITGYEQVKNPEWQEPEEEEAAPAEAEAVPDEEDAAADEAAPEEEDAAADEAAPVEEDAAPEEDVDEASGEAGPDTDATPEEETPVEEDDDSDEDADSAENSEEQGENPENEEPAEEPAEDSENEEPEEEPAADSESNGAIVDTADEELIGEADGTGEQTENTEDTDVPAADGDGEQTENTEDTDVPAADGEAEEPEEPAAEEIPEFIDEPIYSRAVKSANIFWSHDQDSLYTDFDHEHTKSLDWGVVKLAGYNGSDAFAYSEWRITKILDYMNSASFPKGVYTAASQAVLDAAVTEANIVINSTYKDKATTDRVAETLEKAFYGLKWGDTKYPDPSDLPKQVTLPNTYRFFGSDRLVKNASDWEARRKEILDLAQFYEYGYKPEYDSLTVKSAAAHKAGDKKYRWSNSQGKYVEDGTYSESAVSITVTVTVGSKSKDISFDVSMPSEAQIEANGLTEEKLPIVLSFDGAISAYSAAGFAQITVPSVVSDTRTNDYAWNKRTGTFYDLYPYVRNGEAALKEVSNEMAEAWAASLIIDALELCEKSEKEEYNNAVAQLAVDKLAVTGFSINGKYAFVSAVFDDRIDVCIPGAAGATGPSPWRYVYRGQVYDWTGTAYVNSQVDSYQTAWGTEVIANSVRHNRVRETELFRHFMTPGHFYEFEDGAYGYATRLPYDQNDLIATLAPRAIIIENTVNDYNDGCTADCLGAEIAKSVYKNLGYDADDLVKFNLRGLKTGDPHGNDSEQRGRSAEYLQHYFFGKDMSEATDQYLGTDPFSLKISNNKTENPYDYYWGGFNTITGGTGGVEGRDGWFYYTFPASSQGSQSQSGTSSSGSTQSVDTAAPAQNQPAAGAPSGRMQNATPGRITEVPETEEAQDTEIVNDEETPLTNAPEATSSEDSEQKETTTEANTDASPQEVTDTTEPVEEALIEDEATALAATASGFTSALVGTGAVLAVVLLGALAVYIYVSIRKSKRS